MFILTQDKMKVLFKFYGRGWEFNLP